MTIATEALLASKSNTCDSMDVTWNLVNGEEVEATQVLFRHNDDFMDALANALVEAEIEWAAVTSYIVTIVKDVEWNKQMYESGNEVSN